MAVAVFRGKPSLEECSYSGHFHVANDRAIYIGSLARFKVRLTSDQLWLRKDLSIPLDAISDVKMIRKGKLIPRHALCIVFVNPVSGASDAAYLCDTSVIGIYHKPKLLKLEGALNNAMKERRNAVDRSFDGEGSTTPIELPKRIGAITFLISQIKCVIAPRQRAVRGLCCSILAALEPQAEPDGWSDDALISYTEELMKQQDDVASNFDFSVQCVKYVLFQRLYACWNLLWLLFVPVGLVLWWFVPGMIKREPSVANVAAFIVVAGFGFSILVSLGALVHALLSRLYTWLVCKFTGVEVTQYKSRRF